MCTGLQKLILQAGEPSSGVFNYSIVWLHAQKDSWAVSLLSQSALPAACLPPANTLDTPPSSNISSMCTDIVCGMSLEQVKMFDIVRMD